MIALLIKWWHRRQRAIDLAILWPTIRDRASDLNTARLAFAYHAIRDHAWHDFSVDEIVAIVDKLE